MFGWQIVRLAVRLCVHTPGPAPDSVSVPVCAADAVCVQSDSPARAQRFTLGKREDFIRLLTSAVRVKWARNAVRIFREQVQAAACPLTIFLNQIAHLSQCTVNSRHFQQLRHATRVVCARTASGCRSWACTLAVISGRLGVVESGGSIAV